MNYGPIHFLPNNRHLCNPLKTLYLQPIYT